MQQWEARCCHPFERSAVARQLSAADVFWSPRQNGRAPEKWRRQPAQLSACHDPGGLASPYRSGPLRAIAARRGHPGAISRSR